MRTTFFMKFLSPISETYASLEIGEKIALYIIKGIAVLGLLLIITAIATWLWCKMKKKHDTISEMIGVSGIIIMVVAELSSYVIKVSPYGFSDSAASGNGGFIYYILMIALCLLSLIVSEKRKGNKL